MSEEQGHITPRHYKKDPDAKVKDFFEALASALGGDNEVRGQCAFIVDCLKRRGVFDLGGLFSLHKQTSIDLCFLDPGGGFTPPGDSWAESVQELAQFKFTDIEWVLFCLNPPPLNPLPF